jgi:hypothetical protein
VVVAILLRVADMVTVDVAKPVGVPEREGEEDEDGGREKVADAELVPEEDVDPLSTDAVEVADIDEVPELATVAVPEADSV